MLLKTLRKILHISIGILFLIFGIIGLVLPILNGILFLILGFIVISFESPYVEKKLLALTRRHNGVHHWHIKLEKLMKRLFRR